MIITSTYTDRWVKKVRIVYATDLGRGVCYLVLAMLVYYFMGNNNTDMVLLSVYLFLILITIQSAFFSPAVQALIPQIVKKDELVAASSIFQITSSVQNLIGFFFGAIIYITLGIVPLMIINGVSFIFSGLSEMFIKYDSPKNNVSLEKNGDEEKLSFSGHIKRILDDIKTVFKYLFTDGKPILMVSLMMFSMITLVAPWFVVGDPYMIKTAFKFTLMKPEYILASSEMVEAIAVIIISFIIASIAKKFKIYQLYRFSGAMFIFLAIFYISIIYSYDIGYISELMFITLFIVANFLAGLLNASTKAPISAAMHKYIEPKHIGKVISIVNSFGGLMFPLTLLLAGYLIDFHSMYLALGMMFVGMIVITIVAYSSKEIKKIV